MPTTPPRALSLNVGTVRRVVWRYRELSTGIWKHAVGGRFALRGVNFVGDDQADLAAFVSAARRSSVSCGVRCDEQCQRTARVRRR